MKNCSCYMIRSFIYVCNHSAAQQITSQAELQEAKSLVDGIRSRLLNLPLLRYPRIRSILFPPPDVSKEINEEHSAQKKSRSFKNQYRYFIKSKGHRHNTRNNSAVTPLEGKPPRRLCRRIETQKAANQ